MKYINGLKVILVLTLILTILSPVFLSFNNEVMVQAKQKTENKLKENDKEIKFLKNKVTISVGATYTLALKGTFDKIKWSSSNKKIATVTQEGTVTGIKSGTVKIYAKVGKKKYTCNVTVKNKKAIETINNPYTDKTTYDSQGVVNGNANYVIPKTWVGIQKDKSIQYNLKDADTTKKCSAVVVTVSKKSVFNLTDYDSMKLMIETTLKKQMAGLIKNGATDTSSIVSDYTCDNGCAVMSDQVYTYEGVTYIVKMYDILIGDYWIQIIARDVNDGTTPVPAVVALDILNSLQITE